MIGFDVLKDDGIKEIHKTALMMLKKIGVDLASSFTTSVGQPSL